MSADDTHDELLNDLRRIANEVDPIPAEVTAYAQAALGFRRIDAELGELVESSAKALARSGSIRERPITFQIGDLTLDLEIHEGNVGLSLLGLFSRPTRARIEVQRNDGSIAGKADTDELGRFRIELEAGGLIRLRITRRPPSSPAETIWIEV